MTLSAPGRSLWLYVVVVCCFSVSPVVIVLLESFTAADYVFFPPEKLSLRWYVEIGRRPEFLEAVKVSVLVATGASLFATTLGTLTSLALVRYRFPGRALLQGLFMSPLSLPAMVLGIALLQFYAANGVSRDGLTLMLAHLVLTVPFSIRLVSVGLTGMDRSVELAAQSLGASPMWTFWLVTLPLIRPGVIASLVFTFIISFDEVALSLFLSGPNVMTLPVRIFVYIEQNYDPFITSISSILVLSAVVVTIVLERTVGVGRMFGIR